MTKTFITASQVAERIGYNTAMTFLQNRNRLETHENFPLPLATSRNPMKWRADAIANWTASQGLPTPLQIAIDKSANVVLLKQALTP